MSSGIVSLDTLLARVAAKAQADQPTAAPRPKIKPRPPIKRKDHGAAKAANSTSIVSLDTLMARVASAKADGKTEALKATTTLTPNHPLAFPTLVFIKSPRRGWDDDNKEPTGPQEMTIPVVVGTGQVTLYVDCCDGRGNEEDVDVIRLQWTGSEMKIYSHRMGTTTCADDPRWDDYGRKGVNQSRWDAGGAVFERVLTVGKTIEIAFWEATLVAVDRLEFRGVETVCAWVPPPRFEVTFERRQQHVLELDSEAKLCSDFKRCHPVELWYRWDGLWIRGLPVAGNAIDRQRGNVEDHAPKLLWAPLLADDGAAQTFSFEPPASCFALPGKGLPYSVYWTDKDDLFLFRGVEGYPGAVMMLIDSLEYVDVREHRSARILAPIDVPRFGFRVNANSCRFVHNERGGLDLVPVQIADQIINDP